jgi:hypothetical protein
MSKAIIAKDDMALLKETSEMFNETGCVPGIDGEQVPAERIVPDVKEYISERIDDPEAIYDPEIWDTPGFTLATGRAPTSLFRVSPCLSPPIAHASVDKGLHDGSTQNFTTECDYGKEPSLAARRRRQSAKIAQRAVGR